MIKIKTIDLIIILSKKNLGLDCFTIKLPVKVYAFLMNSQSGKL